MRHQSNEYLESIAILLILGLACLIYWPGLSGIFLVDDIQNLAELNVNGGVTSWSAAHSFVFGNSSGVLGRPISMLSFLINDNAYPGSVASYRHTNVMLHLLVGLSFFCLIRMILLASGLLNKGRYRLVALIAFAWWMMSPLNVSTTLYVVQRMTQLSALFCFMGLGALVYGRWVLSNGRAAGRLYAVVGLYAFGGLAVLSKENGALIFLYAVVIEKTIAYLRQEKTDTILLAFISAPLWLGGLYFLTHISGYTNAGLREFTVYERVLTEARILWAYLYKIVFPILGGMGLVHDDIVISKGVFEPISTFISLVAHLALVALAYCFRRQHPWLFLGVFVFYSGHLLESSVIPLELYFEHRNYFVSGFVYLLVCSSIVLVTEKHFQLVTVAISALVLVSGVVCLQRSTLWGNPKAQIYVWAEEHPHSIRAQTIWVRSLIGERRYEEAEHKLRDMTEKWPNVTHVYLVLFNQACLGRVDPKWLTFDAVFNGQGVYTGSLMPVLENSFSLYQAQACRELDNRTMLQILNHSLQVDLARPLFKAKIHVWRMEVFAREGDLNGAISALDEAFDNQADSYLMFLKSGLFFSAGLHDLAIESVDYAMELENLRRVPLADRVEKYRRLKANIEKAMMPSPSP